MAYNIVAGDILRVTLVMVDANQVGLNVLNYRVSTVTGNVSQTQVAGTLDTAFAASYKPMLYDGASWRGTMVQKVWPLPSPAMEFSVSNAGVGTAGAVSLPSQTAGLIGKRTALAGRSYRGRLYIPFPSDTSNQTTGIPTTTYNTNLGSLAAFLALNQTIGSGGNVATLVPGIYHSRAPKPPATLPLQHTITDMTGTTVGPFWATQRRRGNFGRINISPI